MLLLLVDEHLEDGNVRLRVVLGLGHGGVHHGGGPELELRQRAVRRRLVREAVMVVDVSEAGKVQHLSWQAGFRHFSQPTPNNLARPFSLGVSK